MNSQPHPSPQSADDLIDRVLKALGTAEASAGLEHRVEQRLAARSLPTASSRQPFGSSFSVIRNALQAPLVWIAHLPLYAYASIALLLVLLLTLHMQYKPHEILQTQLLPLPTMPQPPRPYADLAQAHRGAHSTLNPRRHSENAQPSGDPTDPDTIALAETLAPSHPAPPMPLTPQERLLVSATREGAPIGLAELQLARASAFRATSEAHKKAELEQFARNLLAPLAISESLESTAQNDVQTNTSSSSN